MDSDIDSSITTDSSIYNEEKDSHAFNYFGIIKFSGLLFAMAAIFSLAVFKQESDPKPIVRSKSLKSAHLWHKSNFATTKAPSVSVVNRTPALTVSKLKLAIAATIFAALIFLFVWRLYGTPDKKVIDIVEPPVKPHVEPHVELIVTPKVTPPSNWFWIITLTLLVGFILIVIALASSWNSKTKGISNFLDNIKFKDSKNGSKAGTKSSEGKFDETSSIEETRKEVKDSTDQEKERIEAERIKEVELKRQHAKVIKELEAKNLMEFFKNGKLTDHEKLGMYSGKALNVEKFSAVPEWNLAMLNIYYGFPKDDKILCLEGGKWSNEPFDRSDASVYQVNMDTLSENRIDILKEMKMYILWFKCICKFDANLKNDKNSNTSSSIKKYPIIGRDKFKDDRYYNYIFDKDISEALPFYKDVLENSVGFMLVSQQNFESPQELFLTEDAKEIVALDMRAYAIRNPKFLYSPNLTLARVENLYQVIDEAIRILGKK